MSREKQIEEMAETMRHSCEKECRRNKYGEFDCEYCEAELLYNAGYRKQSEGEWIRRYSDHTDHLGTFKKYDGDFCSICGVLGSGEFCPNCGAKMKGV